MPRVFAIRAPSPAASVTSMLRARQLPSSTRAPSTAASHDLWGHPPLSGTNAIPRIRRTWLVTAFGVSHPSQAGTLPDYGYGRS
jgi:hypothetical protein